MGNKFTWSNGSHWAKIDRVLTNSAWSSLNFNTQADFLDYNTQSDHTPIVVSFAAQTQTKGKPFKFLNMWMAHPEFSSTVRDNWDVPIYGTKQYILCMKLKKLKPLLKSLSRQHFTHISERASRAQKAFSENQKLLLNDPNSLLLKDKVKESRITANFLLEAKRQFLQQKLKNKNHLFADRGTNYFHTMIKKKNSSNTITSFLKSDGTNTTSQEEVISEFIKYYENLLCVDTPVQTISAKIINKGPILSDEDHNILSAPIEDDEIKRALFHIGDDKAPGPDGYTAAFFKSTQDTIQRDFLLVVHKFFRNGKILKQVNHAAIALIPKVKHAPQAKDFRPISCSNVLYKTITKIIANRLASVVPNMVDATQCAFLEERVMTDHILLAQELIRRYGRKSCTPRSMITVDIRKAFDTVAWRLIWLLVPVQ